MFNEAYKTPLMPGIDEKCATRYATVEATFSADICLDRWPRLWWFGFAGCGMVRSILLDMPPFGSLSGEISPFPSEQNTQTITTHYQHGGGVHPVGLLILS